MRDLVEQAAQRLEAGQWFEQSPKGDRLCGAWLVGAFDIRDPAREYAARAAFGEWWSPAEHRADGLRTSETACEKGMRLGRRQAVAALRAFVATLPEGAAA